MRGFHDGLDNCPQRGLFVRREGEAASRRLGVRFAMQLKLSLRNILLRTDQQA